MCPSAKKKKKEVSSGGGGGGGGRNITPGSSSQLTAFSLASQRVNAWEESAEKKHFDSCSVESTNVLGVL